jgi:acyl dehydratase
VGQRFTSGCYRMDEEWIKSFAAEFDPQPFHLDAPAAQATVFNGLAASGWHTAAVAMRLLVTGGLGGELAWPNPTVPGDTLHVDSEIAEIVPSRSKPNRAVVKVKSTTLNQEGMLCTCSQGMSLCSSGRSSNCAGVCSSWSDKRADRENHMGKLEGKSHSLRAVIAALASLPQNDS